MKRRATLFGLILIVSVTSCISQESTINDWWTISAERTIGNVTVLHIDWTPGVFKAYQKRDGEYIPYDLQSLYKAKVYLPRKSEANMVVRSLHKEETVMRVDDREFAEIASKTGTVLMVYGEKSSDWETLNFEGRDPLVIGGLYLVMRPDSDGVRGDFASWLKHTMRKALDLGIAVSGEYSITIDRVGVMGGSKEGLATWLVSCEDERIFAAAPGAFRYQDFTAAVKESIKEWGCTNPNPRWVKTDYYPHPADFMALIQYARNHNMEDRLILDVSQKIDELTPEFFIVHGDANTAKTHDGAYFPLLGENAFLTNLKGYKDFRYVRDGSNSRSHYVFDALITVVNFPEVIEVWPNVTEVETLVSEGGVTVSACINGDVSGAKLVYGISDDSAWNNGDEQWNSLPMVPSERGWTAEMQIDAEKGYAVYVEVYYTAQIETVTIDLYDTSLIELIVSPYTQWCTKLDYRLITEYIGEQNSIHVVTTMIAL